MVDTTVHASKCSSSIKDDVTAHVRVGVNFLCSHHDASTEDVLRIFHDQISNMVISEQVRSAMTLDPFEHLKESIPSNVFKRIVDSMNVISHHSVKTLEGYVRTEAVVSCSMSDNHCKNNGDVDASDGSTAKSSSRVAHSKAGNKKKKRPRILNGNDEPQSDSGLEGVKLRFTYTRSSMMSMNPCTISYTIDLCKNTFTSPMPLLWIHVYAAGTVPSSQNANHATNLLDTNDDDTDDQWSDIDENDNSSNSSSHINEIDVKENNGDVGRPPRHDTVVVTSARATTMIDLKTEADPILASKPDNDTGTTHSTTCDDDNLIDSEVNDRYVAGMDPDVVSQLASYLQSVSFKGSNSDNVVDFDDITIFFLLMTFPFYEHEWDIVGFLLQAIFDNSDDNERDEY